MTTPTFTLTITPAWDRRDPDPSKDYGIHCCELHALVSDGDRAVSLNIFTGWFLQPVETLYPMAADLSTHRLCEPTEELDEYNAGVASCPFIGNRPCVCMSTTLGAKPYLDILIKSGSEGLEKAMREHFDKFFNTPTT